MFKKVICTLLASIIMSSACIAIFGGCSDNGSDDVSSVSSDEFIPHKFGKSDLTVNDKIRLCMTVEEVKAILGEPDSEITNANDDFIYGKYTNMKYGGLSLTFYDVSGGDELTLGIINSSSESDKFANGLSAGSSSEELFYVFTKSEDNLPLYFGGLEDCYGSYVYGSYTSEAFIEEKPMEEIQYAYINKWGVDNGYENEYTIEYYYFDPLEWNDEQTKYSGSYYSMIFYMDAESDLVTSISLTYNAIL